MGLETYQKMRDFRRTHEPRGKMSKANRKRFVVQEHHASKAVKRESVVSARGLKSENLEGDLNVRVVGEVVPLTHLERVYWPEEGYAKGDLVRYYHEISRYILPYLEDRPLIMKRYPSGVGGQSFHQHDIHQGVPGFMRTAALEVEKGLKDFIYRPFRGGLPPPPRAST